MYPYTAGARRWLPRFRLSPMAESRNCLLAYKKTRYSRAQYRRISRAITRWENLFMIARSCEGILISSAETQSSSTSQGKRSMKSQERGRNLQKTADGCRPADKAQPRKLFHGQRRRSKHRCSSSHGQAWSRLREMSLDGHSTNITPTRPLDSMRDSRHTSPTNSLSLAAGFANHPLPAQREHLISASLLSPPSSSRTLTIFDFDPEP